VNESHAAGAVWSLPERLPCGRPVPRPDVKAHRSEIRAFADAAAGDEVVFHACSYGELLSAWRDALSDAVRAHAAALAARSAGTSF